MPTTPVWSLFLARRCQYLGQRRSPSYLPMCHHHSLPLPPSISLKPCPAMCPAVMPATASHSANMSHFELCKSYSKMNPPSPHPFFILCSIFWHIFSRYFYHPTVVCEFWATRIFYDRGGGEKYILSVHEMYFMNGQDSLSPPPYWSTQIWRVNLRSVWMSLSLCKRSVANLWPQVALVGAKWSLPMRPGAVLEVFDFNPLIQYSLWKGGYLKEGYWGKL